MMVRLVLIWLATEAGGLLYTPRIMRRNICLKSSTQEAESSKWMAEYLVRVHEARIDAVARAREEAQKEALDRIAELEAQLAEIKSAKSAVSETVIAEPHFESEATISQPEPTETIMNKNYQARISDMERLKGRWGDEELGRISSTLVVPISQTKEQATSSPAPNQNYKERNQAKEALYSRWGAEELQRIEQETS
mmetsp:Transcript_2703/g.3698  ORF Transcript_2703/g.3698 Transcript_2703/m.3698 type:complete len:195 (-) Transcript_2703:1576-2160(-)